jgi:hypothetical protein
MLESVSVAGGRVTATLVTTTPVSAIPCSATHGADMIATTDSVTATNFSIAFEVDSTNEPSSALQLEH